MINILCYSANKYSELVKNNVIYTFTIGRKGKSKRIIIDFTNNEFYHLAGLHYIKDVEFPSPKAEEIFLLIRDNNEFQEKILASSKLPKIIERLTHIEHLDAVLNHPDDVVVWEQKRANFSTNLKADYLVSRMHDSVYDIFGIKKSSDEHYKGNTFIVETNNKYTNGQTKWAILKIERSCKGYLETLFTHKNYKE